MGFLGAFGGLPWAQANKLGRPGSVHIKTDLSGTTACSF